MRAYSLHPGAILTPLGRHLQAEDLDAVMTLDESGSPVLPDFKSPEQGAATAVWAATAAELDEHSGAYLEDCRLAEVIPAGSADDVGRQGLRARSGRRRPALGLVGRADRGGRVQPNVTPTWRRTSSI